MKNVILAALSEAKEIEGDYEKETILYLTAVYAHRKGNQVLAHTIIRATNLENTRELWKMYLFKNPLPLVNSTLKRVDSTSRMDIDSSSTQTQPSAVLGKRKREETEPALEESPTKKAKNETEKTDSFFTPCNLTIENDLSEIIRKLKFYKATQSRIRFNPLLMRNLKG